MKKEYNVISLDTTDLNVIQMRQMVHVQLPRIYLEIKAKGHFSHLWNTSTEISTCIHIHILFLRPRYI